MTGLIDLVTPPAVHRPAGHVIGPAEVLDLSMEAAAARGADRAVHSLSGALPPLRLPPGTRRACLRVYAILSPDWEYRYYSFNSAWAEGEEMASMRNGSGDEYSIVFSAAGAYVRGFDHESPMSLGANDGEVWPGVIDGVPTHFRSCVEEPAFSNGDHVPAVTACIWRETADTRWRHGTIDFPAGYDDPDGANRLFHLLTDPSPKAYQRFAEDYYEVPVNHAAVRRVYALRPLSPALVSGLNEATSLSAVAEEIRGIGYSGLQRSSS
ncbi:hypothetical protein ACFUN8_00085 [Streptomyces sp. NPDC057307]|uniref:hypothetical protein n=1 Tax=Streptomyces sp. NPDC057307 TaxID=3346096 RepID=UPI003635CB47